MTDEAKEILSRSLVNQISQLQTERDTLRTERDAERERNQRLVATWGELPNWTAIRLERDALRAELAAERERKEHYQTLFKDMVPQAVALRAALVKAGEALEKSRVFTNGEFLRRSAGDDESYDEDEQAIPLLCVLDAALTEIRKLLESSHG